MQSKKAGPKRLVEEHSGHLKGGTLDFICLTAILKGIIIPRILLKI
jgi:hypothetical protein